MPSSGTVNVVRLQLVLAVDVVAHNFTEDAVSVAPDPAASFVSGEIVWLVSYAPVDVSFDAVGTGGTLGVNVDVAV
jgi:hypothetical protein